MTKNVAEEIFEKLCESVATSLEAKRLASFTRISSTVQGLDDDAALQVMKLYEELRTWRQRRPCFADTQCMESYLQILRLSVVVNFVLFHVLRQYATVAAACSSFPLFDPLFLRLWTV